MSRLCALPRALVALLLAAGLLAAVAAPSARADGDPASDVLVSSPPLFLSSASGATYAQKLALTHQLQTAARRGRSLRVAVIAARQDLGSVTGYWGQPQAYAVFLDEELELVYHGTLLVVMPNGFGVARRGVAVTTTLAGRYPRPGQLLTATEQAIARLTGVSPVTAAPTQTGSAPSRVGGVGFWAASAAALALLAALWAMSLRRRPPGSVPATTSNPSAP